ncbi:hypothetical protein K439DRAFT_728481 [Ramaria rubella]|nr:hypothetical protein K439DRAFT_728481 [Ramaria rubella]
MIRISGLSFFRLSSGHIPPRLMYTTITIVWTALNMAGQVSLFVLLSTYLLCKDLPGRKNIYLINFLFTTFLATIPPCLLFYAGQQEAPAHWICVVQSILMDGISPMFEVALLILVFQTWAGIRAIICVKSDVISSSAIAKSIFLLCPYAALVGWCTASTIQAFQPQSTYSLGDFAYCDNSSKTFPFILIRQRIRPFLITCGILQILFEIWIAFFLISGPRSITRPRISSSTYQNSRHIYARLCIFTLLQLGPVLLAVINSVVPQHSVTIPTQVLESMDAVVTFLVFGSQSDILQKWRLLKPATDSFNGDALEANAKI